MPNEKLDQQRIRQLLQEADDKWFTAHFGHYNYHDHLDFVAIYIARNYNRKAQPQAGKSR